MKLVQAFIKPFEVPQKIISIKFRSIFSRVRDCEFKRCKGLYSLWIQLVMCICWQVQSSKVGSSFYFKFDRGNPSHILDMHTYLNTLRHTYTHIPVRLIQVRGFVCQIFSVCGCFMELQKAVVLIKFNHNFVIRVKTPDMP